MTRKNMDKTEKMFDEAFSQSNVKKLVRSGNNPKKKKIKQISSLLGQPVQKWWTVVVKILLPQFCTIFFFHDHVKPTNELTMGEGRE